MTDTSRRSGRRALSVTAVATLLALAGCSAPDDAATSLSGPAAPPQPRVLFQAAGPDHLLVAVAGLDGSGVTYPLEDLPGGNQTNPDWSPDGTQVVFTVDDGQRDDLWISGADGSGARKLLDCVRACRWYDDASWSPDGSSLVVSRTVARGGTGLGSLEVVDVATGEESVVVAPRARTFTSGARWSPDGSQIVFESVHKAGPGLEAEVDGVTLRVVEPATGRIGPPLTAPDLFAATADWSPDGATIVYSGLAAPDAEEPDLFAIPAGGGQPRRLTTLATSGGFAVEPTWRADSEHLVFSGRLPGSFVAGVLLTVAADGSSEPRELGATRLVGRHPRVEPGS